MRISAPFLLLMPAALAAQVPQHTVLDEAREISLARSAAPAQVSDSATVWVLRGQRYAVAVEGSNGNHCMVSRSEIVSLEPICYDSEASKSILPMEIRRVELLLDGVPLAEVERRQAEAIGTGEFRVPTRPAMSYMMSSEQLLYDQGRRVGTWLPHLMIYMPYATNADLGMHGAPAISAFAVFKEGTPLAHVVIPVRAFEQPR